ncbi:MAG TPA: peptide chain release factor N(5)-glutamine methyltransferase [Acidimicrobiales bacterium]|nr:peptide chain release factor N(5)-glutamine methyltransferase [Acidimicrobiales bacterium]
MTFADLIVRSTERLGPESAPQARWIVAHAAGVSGSQLPTLFDREVNAEVRSFVDELLDRVDRGEPLQYAIGSWQFRDLELAVDPRVLIPRPETESIVDFALEELEHFEEQFQHLQRGRDDLRQQDDPIVVADLGTGSGAIALSISLEGTRSSLPTSTHYRRSRRRIEVWATDNSQDALDVASQNLRALERVDPGAAGCVRLAKGSWFDALPTHLQGRVALIVSNPPYVSESEWELLDPVVRDHEPVEALVAGPTGVEDLARLIEVAPRWMLPGGSLVLELAPAQAVALAELARSSGRYADVRARKDLAGRVRAVVARTPPQVR